MHTRIVNPNDVFALAQLYFEVYGGTYPDPMMKDFLMMRDFMAVPGNCWFVAEDAGRLMGSVIYRYDAENRLAKVYAAVVGEDFRRLGVSDAVARYGKEYIEQELGPLEVVYATTRTVNEAAQAAIEKLGHRKLGIFPNVHRTRDYETHCLTGWFSEIALARRQPAYSTHIRAARLVDLAATEVGIPAPAGLVPDSPSRTLRPSPSLECVRAPAFVRHRFQILQREGALDFWYYPFHTPNMMLLSEDQSVEIFLSLSPLGGHCVIIGGKVRSDVSYSDLLEQICRIVRNEGGRYFEIIIRADKPKIIESVMNARFIPSAFFPAMQRIKEIRYDYLVLSRTFEIFDFRNVQLRGVNNLYLQEYFQTWKSLALSPRLLDEEVVHAR